MVVFVLNPALLRDLELSTLLMSYVLIVVKGFTKAHPDLHPKAVYISVVEPTKIWPKDWIQVFLRFTQTTMAVERGERLTVELHLLTMVKAVKSVGIESILRYSRYTISIEIGIIITQVTLKYFAPLAIENNTI